MNQRSDFPWDASLSVASVCSAHILETSVAPRTVSLLFCRWFVVGLLFVLWLCLWLVCRWFVVVRCWLLLVCCWFVGLLLFVVGCCWFVVGCCCWLLLVVCSCVRVFVCLSACWFVGLFVCLSVCLFFCVFLFFAVCLFVFCGLLFLTRAFQRCACPSQSRCNGESENYFFVTVVIPREVPTIQSVQNMVWTPSVSISIEA